MKEKNIISFFFTVSIAIILLTALTKFDFIKKLYIAIFHKTATIGHFNRRNKLDGEVDTYVNGKLVRKANLKDGLFDGWITDYYPNQAIKTKSFYKNNNITGDEINYYNDGKIKSTEGFKDGKVEGYKITYYRSGKIKQKSSRKNGKVEGTEYTYYEDGNLQYTRRWLNDKPYGELQFYYKNKTLGVYHTYDILGDKFYLCRYDQSGKVSRSDGYVFSSRTYSKCKDSIIVLEVNKVYTSIKDFYVTVANPPQSITEIKIVINNKLREDLSFPDHNTVLIKNAFDHNGVYTIKIDGVFMENSRITNDTKGELRIIKESGQ